MRTPRYSSMILFLCSCLCGPVYAGKLTNVSAFERGKPSAQSYQPSPKHWVAQGSLAIRQGNRGSNSFFHWQQASENRYEIRLFSAMGAGNTVLSGRPGTVRITTAKGQQAQAGSAEALMKKQLGWSLPISPMYYWIRGIKAPTGAAKMMFDRNHHLQRIEQNGWTVEYSNYQTVGVFELPTRIDVSHSERVYAKIRVSTWDELA